MHASQGTQAKLLLVLRKCANFAMCCDAVCCKVVCCKVVCCKVVCGRVMGSGSSVIGAGVCWERRVLIADNARRPSRRVGGCGRAMCWAAIAPALGSHKHEMQQESCTSY